MKSDKAKPGRYLKVGIVKTDLIADRTGRSEHSRSLETATACKEGENCV